MCTLLVDATSLDVNPKGVGKYAYEIITRLDQLLPQSWCITLVVFQGAVPALDRSERLTSIAVDHQSDLRLGLQTIPSLIRKSRADLMLRLCDCAGKAYSVRTLSICHDINELIRQAQGVKPGIVRRIINHIKENFRIRALQASAMVVCNSEFTRQQCISRYGIGEEKTVVGYCGVQEAYYHTDKDEAAKHTKRDFGCERYILCFATGDPRENYTIIPDVIVASKQLGMHARFVIAGVRPGHSYARQLEKALLDRSLREGMDFFFVPFLGNSVRGKLCDLYAAADYYLELSLHEGFGMQLAEAMACGTACLAPAHSALAEVGGPYVLHMDPTDASDIAGTLAAAYRQQLHLLDHSEQVAYTRRFSWDETAAVIADNLTKLGEMAA